MTIKKNEIIFAAALLVLVFMDIEYFLRTGCSKVSTLPANCGEGVLYKLIILVAFKLIYPAVILTKFLKIKLDARKKT